MTPYTFVGAVTEYRPTSLDRVQRGVRWGVRTTGPARTGNGGGT